MPHNSDFDNTEAGFTLIESLVAFAIASLALAALYEAARISRAETLLAAAYSEASQRAQSHLAEIGILTPLANGTSQGDDGDGFRWVVTIRRLDQRPPVAPGRAAAPWLYQIDLIEAWGAAENPHQIVLHSLKLGPPGKIPAGAP